ncbi:MAG: DUF934 domain-containing protein [Polaromonas sp.]
MKLIAAHDYSTGATGQNVIELANDADPRELSLAGVECIALNFPKFTDGRAFSQAFLLRRRLRFKGDIRATGDVLADQLAQMERSGFTSAVLRADQDLDLAQRVLSHNPGYGVGKYQGDAVQVNPHFAN